MIELIVIKENDEDAYISLTWDEDIKCTKNVQEALTFKSVEDAKYFASLNLDDIQTYDIVKVTIQITEEQLDTINY